MARARFVAQGQAGHTCEVFGQEFPHGTWVDVSGLAAEHVDRLAANPTFEVEPDAPATAPKGRPKPAEG